MQNNVKDTDGVKVVINSNVENSFMKETRWLLSPRFAFIPLAKKACTK